MKKIKIDLTLLDDGANGIGYHDCAADLREPWYRAYGDPDGSVLYLRVSANLMPPELAPLMPKHFKRLTAEEVETVREWIAAGAADD